MKSSRMLGAAAVLTWAMVAAGSAGQEAPQVAPDGLPCETVGEIRFICDLISPEDLAVVPGSDWIIASGNRPGGKIHLVNVANKATTVLYPGAVERLDANAYASCPGPMDPNEGDAFAAHGLYLDPGPGDVHTLLVVHHGNRESIEVFEVDARGTPSLTWIGCAVVPGSQRLNGVVALPDGGGFVATSPGTGDVWEWTTASGWEQVPGSDDTAPNGIEISADGEWLFIAGWAEEKLTRLSRGRDPVDKTVIDLGFRPDNLRMSLDGSVIYAAGHGDIQDPRRPLEESSNIAAIDPQTLRFERIWEHPALAGFVASTTAIQVGDEMWLGSHRGERVAYFPAP